MNVTAIVTVNDIFIRPVRHSLGAEELLELGKTGSVPAYRYAHTPFLANRPAMGRTRNSNPNLFMGAETAPVAQVQAPRANMLKALTIGIPIAGAAAVLLMVAR